MPNMSAGESGALSPHLVAPSKRTLHGYAWHHPQAVHCHCARARLWAHGQCAEKEQPALDTQLIHLSGNASEAWSIRGLVVIRVHLPARACARPVGVPVSQGATECPPTPNLHNCVAIAPQPAQVRDSLHACRSFGHLRLYLGGGCIAPPPSPGATAIQYAHQAGGARGPLTVYSAAYAIAY